MVVVASYYGVVIVQLGLGIFTQNLQDSIRQLKNLTFRHDNDLKHKSQWTKEWIQKKEVDILERHRVRAQM